jgi:phosphoribosylformylglycinamidine synthase subunit PurQ / glutaminase
MKFGVVVFPGSNCDRDMIHVLQDVMQQEVKVLWHKDHDLQGLTTDDCIVLPVVFLMAIICVVVPLPNFRPLCKR